MTVERIIQHIFKEPGLEKVTQWELEKLVTDYPFFTAARVLLAKRAYQRSSDLQHEAVIKALLYTNTPHYFYQFIQSPPDLAPVPEVQYGGDLTASAGIVPDEATHNTTHDGMIAEATPFVSTDKGTTTDELPHVATDEINSAGPFPSIEEITLPAAPITDNTVDDTSISAPDMITLPQDTAPPHIEATEPEKQRLSFHEEMEAFRQQLAEQIARESSESAIAIILPVEEPAIDKTELITSPEKTPTAEDAPSDFHIRMESFRQSLLASEDTAEEGATDQSEMAEDAAHLQNFNVHRFQDELEAIKNRFSVTENDTDSLKDTLESGAFSAAGALADQNTDSPETIDATLENGDMASLPTYPQEPVIGEVSQENEGTFRATLEAGAIEAAVQTENQQGLESTLEVAAGELQSLPDFIQETPAFAGINVQHEPETTYDTPIIEAGQDTQPAFSAADIAAKESLRTDKEQPAFSVAASASEISSLTHHEPPATVKENFTEEAGILSTQTAEDDIPPYPEGTLAGEASTWDDENETAENETPAFSAPQPSAASNGVWPEEPAAQAAPAEPINKADIQLVSDVINDQLPVPSSLPAESEEAAPSLITTWLPPQQQQANGEDTAGETVPQPAADHATVVPEADTYEDGPIKIYPLEMPEETDLTFQPLYTDDYFAYKKLQEPQEAETMSEKGQHEMKSFTNWLRTMKDSFAEKNKKDWYHEQLHRLYEEEEESGISERVEKMALRSITLDDDIVSETLAEIWAKQRQHQKAIQIYKKLSLLNPGKSAYFAQKINELQSDINK
ncbi:hypothetical protein GA0116948_109128 [Chitinophaga costaii]|uniref:Uncharacterized protein n=1 Tax=Chitinophaga costaii TaxID=1335309 RepID=A0A1C4ER36_9BACT|nr:hypothetical protein [Chitinophaga costaii]PUZ22529.1 hypothetical protein DCM91_14780 [Chitinophaga costaii]SCC45973.1 hypothetical protein GA0116948_109128 [Chitinophaga costaii]